MIYITGDIHGDIRPLLEFIEEQQLGVADTIILLGDAGLNFYGNHQGDGRKKQRLNKTGVTIFCIHGNHEKRPQTINTYKEKLWNGGIVYEETPYPNLKFAKDGEVYDLDGFKTIVIGGAYSVDKYYRLGRGIPWFSDEQPSDEIKASVEKKLDESNWCIDFVLSHTCPAKYIPVEAFLPGLSQDEVDRSTEDWLDSIEDKLSYISWYCGHWHINKRIDKMHFLMECKETLPIDSPDDPFYSESNMKHLAAVIADVEAGKNMAVHELLDDEELLDAMKEAKEISADPNVKSYSTMEELKAALED